MVTGKDRRLTAMTPEKQARLERQRELIAGELPELIGQCEQLHEPMQENTFSGQLRRANHQVGRPLSQIAAEAGITLGQLTDFLTGERTLRSDVLDRLTAAVRGQLVVITTER